jgi:hypothetical protein
LYAFVETKTDGMNEIKLPGYKFHMKKTQNK